MTPYQDSWADFSLAIGDIGVQMVFVQEKWGPDFPLHFLNENKRVASCVDFTISLQSKWLEITVFQCT